MVQPEVDIVVEEASDTAGLVREEGEDSEQLREA